MAFPTDFSPDETMLVYELSSSSMWHKEGVVYICPKEGIAHATREAKEQISVFQEKIAENDKQYALICDIRRTNPIDKECRDYYNSQEASQNVRSFAFLVESRYSMVMANFFIGLSTLKVKARLFSSTPEAVLWSTAQIAQ